MLNESGHSCQRHVSHAQIGVATTGSCWQLRGIIVRSTQSVFALLLPLTPDECPELLFIEHPFPPFCQLIRFPFTLSTKASQ